MCGFEKTVTIYNSELQRIHWKSYVCLSWDPSWNIVWLPECCIYRIWEINWIRPTEVTKVFINLFNSFSLESLDYKHKCVALTVLWKLVHNKVDCTELLSEITFQITRLGMRRHEVFCNIKANYKFMVNSSVMLCVNVLMRSQIYMI